MQSGSDKKLKDLSKPYYITNIVFLYMTPPASGNGDQHISCTILDFHIQCCQGSITPQRYSGKHVLRQYPSTALKDSTRWEINQHVWHLKAASWHYTWEMRHKTANSPSELYFPFFNCVHAQEPCPENRINTVPPFQVITSQGVSAGRMEFRFEVYMCIPSFSRMTCIRVACQIPNSTGCSVWKVRRKDGRWQ